MVTEVQKQWLRRVIGQEAAEDLIATAEKATALLERQGVAYKGGETKITTAQVQAALKAALLDLLGEGAVEQKARRAPAAAYAEDMAVMLERNGVLRQQTQAEQAQEQAAAKASRQAAQRSPAAPYAADLLGRNKR